MSTFLLFLTCILIWGSTWLAITFQLGEISPFYSVGLRFGIAALLLGLYCKYKRLDMRLPMAVHWRLVVTGVCLYTLDYVFLYHSQQYLISAWVALLSSSIVYLNVLFRRVLFKRTVRVEVLSGGLLGATGLVILFWEPLTSVDLGQYFMLGLVLATVSFVFASLGNVFSESALDKGAPVVQVNFYAMLYSLPVTFGIALVTGASFVLPNNPDYWLSLLYLSVFGSVLAFGAYMKLVQRLGADKSAYVVLMYPLVALFLSTLFEAYEWHLRDAVGVLLILLGNYVAMGLYQSVIICDRSARSQGH
ncbi:MAG: DMT family transporter [Aestuariibacter sp.]